MKKYDYIITLVGTNPLPSFIITLALMKKGTTLFLLYTKKDENIIDTEKIASNIENEILKINSNLNIIKLDIDKSNIEKIERRLNNDIMSSIFDKNRENSVNICVDYTGSTKILSAQSYDFFKRMEYKYKMYSFEYSYVDAQLQKVMLEKYGSLQFKDINKAYNITIDSIVNLHGYNIKQKSITSNNYCNIFIEDIEKKYSFSFDEVYNFNFNICTIIKSEKNKKNICKMELFKGFNNTKKIGGDLAYFYYLSNIQDKEIADLKNDILSSEMLEIKDRVDTFNKAYELDNKIRLLLNENK